MIANAEILGVRKPTNVQKVFSNSQRSQLSHCHPARHPFTSSTGQQQPIKTALSHPQLFGFDSTNQGRLAGAPDAVSGQGQPITEAPAHLMHCGLLAGSQQARTAVDPTTGVVDPGHYSACQPIRGVISLSDTCGLAESECLHFVVCVCVWICMSISMDVYLWMWGTLLPHSHNALLSYQQASLTLNPSFIIILKLVLPPKGVESLSNKKGLKIGKRKQCLWTNKDD